MKNLYVVRHGETQWNLEQRLQGRQDSPLTDKGKQQAMANGRLLADLGGVDLLCCSPAGRTVETAHLVNSHVGAVLHMNDALLERDGGDWTGLTIEEVKQQDERGWQERQTNGYWHRPPGGENLPDMYARSSEFLYALFDNQVDNIALVTHGVMSRVILKHFLGLDEIETQQLRHPNNLVYRLSFASKNLEVTHYVDGSGPKTGLLNTEPVNNVIRPDSLNN